jgi:hypothetical protein
MKPWRSTTVFLVPASYLLRLPYAVRAQEKEAEIENVPQDIVMQITAASFADNYVLSAKVNPFYLRGDFDGDGRPDYAVRVVSKKGGFQGIVVYLSSQKGPVLLGAGTAFKFGGSAAVDFKGLDVWQVYGKQAVERGVGAGPPPKLVGDAILLGKKDSGSGLIYWDGKKFLWYQQGD